MKTVIKLNVSAGFEEAALKAAKAFAALGREEGVQHAQKYTSGEVTFKVYGTKKGVNVDEMITSKPVSLPIDLDTVADTTATAEADY